MEKFHLGLYDYNHSQVYYNCKDVGAEVEQTFTHKIYSKFSQSHFIIRNM